MSTGWVWHEAYAQYEEGPSAAFLPADRYLEADVHWDNGESRARVQRLIDRSGLLDHLVRIRPEAATDDQLLGVHTVAYLRSAERHSAGKLLAARLAAGGALGATRAVVSGQNRNAYALVRPAGHHASRAAARGGCVFNNVALAVLEARSLGCQRAAVVDWDAHHGNGTQEVFWLDRNVLTVSIHQARPFERSTGDTDALGSGDAVGTCLNIPLPPGAGWGAYRRAMDHIVLPALERFGPEVVFIACGLDANVLDPSARLMLHSEAYRGMTRALVEVCAGLCDGRLVAVHEGGYATAYVPFCGLAVVEELSGVRTAVSDPFLAHWKELLADRLQPHESDSLARAAANLRYIPADRS